MAAFYQIRAVLFGLFGAVCFLEGIFFLGSEILVRIETGVWRFRTFGSGLPGPRLHAANPHYQWIVDVFLNTPESLVAIVVGSALIWQALRGLADAA